MDAKETKGAVTAAQKLYEASNTPETRKLYTDSQRIHLENLGKSSKPTNASSN